jgi:hypothetical protein
MGRLWQLSGGQVDGSSGASDNTLSVELAVEARKMCILDKLCLGGEGGSTWRVLNCQ